MPSQFDYTLAKVMNFMVDYRLNGATPSKEEVAALVAVAEEYSNVRDTLQQVGSKLAQLKRTKVFPPSEKGG